MNERRFMNNVRRISPLTWSALIGSDGESITVQRNPGKPGHLIWEPNDHKAYLTVLLICACIVANLWINCRPLTLARILCFATFAGAGGGGATPSWCFQTKRRRVSRKRPADCSRRILAIGGLFLVIGQYLTQLWQVKGPIFGNSMIFQLYESILAKLHLFPPNLGGSARILDKVHPISAVRHISQFNWSSAFNSCSCSCSFIGSASTWWVCCIPGHNHKHIYTHVHLSAYTHTHTHTHAHTHTHTHTHIHLSTFSKARRSL